MATGDIIGIGQALMWLRDVDESIDIPAVMLFNASYAPRQQPNANVALARWIRILPEFQRGLCFFYPYSRQPKLNKTLQGSRGPI